MADHLAAQGADTQARQARQARRARRARRTARDVMRCFDIAGLAHHEDEERHVIPALLAQGEPAQRRGVGLPP